MRYTHTTIVSLVIVLLFLMTLPASPMMSGPGDQSMTPAIRLAKEEKVYGIDLSQEIYSQVSEESYRAFVKKLTENGSRWTSEDDEGVYFSDANEKARRWIVQTLEEVSGGRIQVEIIGQHKSIIGVLPGWMPGAGPVLMVGGHYDSVYGAPGANDDASGVAAMLELARVMSQYDWPLDIYFCAWNSEELGLLGSWETVQILRDRGIVVLQYFNVDMLLIENPNAPADQRVLVIYNSAAEYQESAYFADLMKSQSNNIGMNLIGTVSSSNFFAWGASDHASFVYQGYPNVVFAFESGFEYDYAYHTSQDVYDNPDYNYTVAVETVASIGATMAFVMSYAFNRPLMFSYTGQLAPGELRPYYLPISIECTVNISVTGSDSPLTVWLADPEGVPIDSTTVDPGTSTTEILLSVPAFTTGLFALWLNNTGSTKASYTLCMEFESDMNADGTPDSQQMWMGGPLDSLDLDNDGLSDAVENVIGTERLNADTDGDGMPDGFEFYNGLDPLTDDAQGDPDGDGVPNIFEYLNGTAPQSADTDGDGMDDLWELSNQLDPLTNDSALDPDNDGRTNLEEYLDGTDPRIYDTPTTTTTQTEEGPTADLLQLAVPAAVSGIVLIVVLLVLVKKRIGGGS